MKSPGKNLGQSTLFTAGSLAKVSPSQEKEKAGEMTATYGRRCFGLYEKFIPDGALRKMSRALLASTTAWYSSKCALIWKVKITKSKRLLLVLSPSTPRTGGIGSGLLRTADANQSRGPSSKERMAWKLKNKMPISINDQIAMLPTPQNRDYRSPDLPESGNFKRKVEQGYTIDLNSQIGKLPGPSLRLQPAMVEWMMGYPLNFTNVGPKGSRHSGTASSRPSPTKSSKESRR